MSYTGEIRAFGFGFAPRGWAACEGQYLAIQQNQALFSVIGIVFGGDGTSNFQLPDLRARVVTGSGKSYVFGTKGGEEFHELTVNEMAAHKHSAIASTNKADVNSPEGHFWPSNMNYRTDTNTVLSDKASGSAGFGAGHPNMAPFLAINYCICLNGEHHTPGNEDAYIGEIVTACRNAANASWLPCDGRELTIAGNTQLFSVIRTSFGGDGRITFKLPDLRGKSALSCGQGEGLTHYDLGETGGFETVTLTEDQLPKHSHAPVAKKVGYATIPNDKMAWAAPNARPAPNAYATTKGQGATMNPGALDSAGGNAPHNNLMPYQVLNFFIAYDGEMPPRT